MAQKTDIAVIGGGPGGYVAAIRCAQLKKKVVVFEEDRVGGTCMNYGCIPTKHLLHQTKVYQEVKKSRTLDGPVSGIALNWTKVQAEKAKVVDRLVRGIEFLFQRYGIELVRGTAAFKDERTSSPLRTKRVQANRSSWPRNARPICRSSARRRHCDREASGSKTAPKRPPRRRRGRDRHRMATIYRRLGPCLSSLPPLPRIDREMAGPLSSS
jgi:dihydrolipoamide dehydrogenase